jgi:hypothetical protein
MSNSDKPTHVYCNTCEKIQPMDQQPLEMIDASGKFIGGDLLCRVCTNVITAVYREMTEAERQANGIGTFSRSFSSRHEIKGRA